jgi:hypothetical protein
LPPQSAIDPRRSGPFYLGFQMAQQGLEEAATRPFDMGGEGQAFLGRHPPWSDFKP